MAKSERTTYSLNNPYLLQDEKVLVESWYQFPGNLMEYTFWAVAVFSLYQPLSFGYVLGIAVGVNAIAGLINWYFYNEKILKFLGLSLFHPFTTGAIGIGVAIFLFMNNAWLLAGISAFVGIFSFLFLEAHLLLYSILGKKEGNMHPKYLFAKKQFGYTFPFENSE